MRILMISPFYPFPVNGGNRVRVFQIFKGLSRFHEVTLVAPFRSGDICPSSLDINPGSSIIPVQSPDLKSMDKLRALFSYKPYHYSLFYSENVRRKVLELIKERPFAIAYCHFIFTLPYLDGFNGPIILDQHNVDRIYWKRKADFYLQQKNILDYLVSRINLEKTIRFETNLLPNLYGIVSVSQEDKSLTNEYASGYISKFIIVPNGVDTNHYKMKNNQESKRIVLGFLGSLDLNLNQDAAIHLCQEILPRVQTQLPDYDVSALIIGKNPPKSLIDFANSGLVKNIHITGTVPDVLPYLHKVDVLVLPLRHGAGTKLRVFEAMSAGVCVVGSGLAFNGIDGLIAGTHALKAESVDQFVNAICYLSKNYEKRLEISKKARELVEEKYEWGLITANLSKSIEEKYGPKRLSSVAEETEIEV